MKATVRITPPESSREISEILRDLSMNPQVAEGLDVTGYSSDADGDTSSCLHCGAIIEWSPDGVERADDEPTPHYEDCPIVRARAMLAALGADRRDVAAGPAPVILPRP